MNNLINPEITKINVNNIVDISIQLEGLLKIIKNIDCEIESFLYIGDYFILENLYSELGGCIGRIEEILEIIKNNKINNGETNERKSIYRRK